MFNSVPQYPHDLGKARQEMAQSAYPHGFTATTTIDNGGAGPNGPNVDQVIAAELHKIGITLKINEVPASQYFSDYDNAPGGDLYVSGTATDICLTMSENAAKRLAGSWVVVPALSRRSTSGGA